MTGIERLRKLAEDMLSLSLWVRLTSGTEKDWDCYQDDGRTLNDELLSIANQIESEARAPFSRMRVLAVVTDMERHVSGVEGMEDSPVARWARELREALGGDGRDHAAYVSVSAYDLLPQEDREAAAWVRYHGGLDHVKAEWRSRVPYDLYERRRQRLLGHIAECETALGRRNRRIEELGRRVNDLMIENTELRRRAMPEGCDEEFIKLHMSNLWGFMFDVMDRLGVDKSDSDAPEIVFDALDRRLMPEGVEWMLWDDGKPVTYDDAPDDVIGVYLALDGSGYVLMTDLPDQLMREPSERVKRPAVLAADGEPLEVGQTVWHVGNGLEFTVVGLPKSNEYQAVKLRLDDGAFTGLDPDQLTHRRPVMDADGVPIREGDTVWLTDGSECHVVLSTDEDGIGNIVTEVQAPGAVKVHISPSRLTHERPESWERIEEDAGCTATKYNEQRGTIFTTKQQVARDLVRRCRALAERERGE